MKGSVFNKKSARIVEDYATQCKAIIFKTKISFVTKIFVDFC